MSAKPYSFSFSCSATGSSLEAAAAWSWAAFRSATCCLVASRSARKLSISLDAGGAAGSSAGGGDGGCAGAGTGGRGGGGGTGGRGGGPRHWRARDWGKAGTERGAQQGGAQPEKAKLMHEEADP